MKYIYTKDMCSACIALKKNYRSKGIQFAERDAKRITQPKDEIDKEMFIKVAQDGMSPTDITLPVEIDI